MHDKPDTRDDRAETAAGANDGAAGGKRSGFRSLVGYTTLTWREEYAEIGLEITTSHLNNAGLTHGGVYMTLLDAAMGHAATWCRRPGHTRPCVTVGLQTSFLAPTRAGERIIAIGRLTGVEGRLATCSGEALNGNGVVLGIAQSSFLYLPGGETVDGVPRPPRTPDARRQP